MANLQVKDGAAATKYLKSSGAGTDGDPHVPEHLETNSAAIKAAVESLDDAISGSELQVDVVAALPAGSNLIGKTQPFAAILEGGLTELVGINEQVDENGYSGSIGVALGGTYSGEILNFCLYSTEDGSGAVLTPAGKLFLLDADPAVASGDTALAAAEWVTVIGIVDVATTDWVTDANGGAAYISDTPVPFHALGTIYFVWLHQDATSFNSAAGDDEQLEFNFWYRRDS